MTLDQLGLGASSDLDPDGSAYRVSFEGQHTLVLCPGTELGSLAEQVCSAGGEGTMLEGDGPFLLLFRAADPAAGGAPVPPPALWIEVGETSLPLIASELTGWDQAGSAAVALLRCGPAAQLQEPPAGAGEVQLRDADGNVLAELPAGWRRHISPLAGAAGA